MFNSKDNRRSDKFSKSKQHFKNHQPRTKKDMRKPREGHNINNDQESIVARTKSRKEYKILAQQTLNILNRGFYYCRKEASSDQDSDISSDSEEAFKVWIKDQLDYAIENTITYKDDMTPCCLDVLTEKFKKAGEIMVVKSTTLGACKRVLLDIFNSLNDVDIDEVNICALNFASAKNPGGGFLKGSNAQEESLVRASGLYECISDSEMYSINKHDNNRSMYSHTMIYSPNVPVFRTDLDNLTEKTYLVSFLTVPAVNWKEALIKGVEESVIKTTAKERMDRLLSIAAYHQVNYLVLGAWGCGVFGGDIEFIGQSFFELLRGKYKGAFQRVVFAVLDNEDFQILDQINQNTKN